jgi:hypothetical protein
MDRVEKYRPVTLDDLVSHKDITSTSMLFTHTLTLAGVSQHQKKLVGIRGRICTLIPTTSIFVLQHLYSREIH